MALTFSQRRASVVGDQREVTGTVTFDSSYPTGGEAYEAALFGLGTLEEVEVRPHNTAASRIVVNDRANSKLKVFTALSTEAANASDQSTIAVDVVVRGR